MKKLSPLSFRKFGRNTDDAAVPTLGVTDTRTVSELVLVYDADGTLSGEVIYITKKLLGLGHCAACDISHGPRREKPEFTALKRGGWGVPMRNIHRDEMDPELERAVRAHLPCLAARLEDGTVVVLLGREPLGKCSGDVTTFRTAVDSALVNLKLEVPPAAPACGLPLPPSSVTDDAVVPGNSSTTTART